MTRKMLPSDSGTEKSLEGEEFELLRDAVGKFVREFMEAEIAARIGAHRYERSKDRPTWRNGYRDREWQTRVGTLDLRIPKLRQGSYLPSFLEPRRRAERALIATVQEAYVRGVSTRSVDALVESLGAGGIDKSRVSRMCEELDQAAEEFRSRTIDTESPYVWLDAMYEKIREGEHVRSMAVVIATAVSVEDTRTVLGFEIGYVESHAFWKDSLRSLVKRGLKGVQLVISDAHEGLKRAISELFFGASWQRCRVHAMRSLLTHVPRAQQAMVLAAVETVLVQTTQQEAKKQLREVVRAIKAKCEKAAHLLEEMADDLLAYMAFPPEHWRQIHSTNPLERLNREIRRRTRVVSIFPNRAAAYRLVGMILDEQDYEWQVPERIYFSRKSMAKVSSSVLAPPALLKETATH
jgi:putative transposase